MQHRVPRWLVLVATVLSGCSEQSWPKANDVYHRQIVLPEMHKSNMGYWDQKTGTWAPEVCDTYGSGQTVCSEASFDKAPPVAQVRAEIAKSQLEWAKGEPAREAQRAEVKRMAKLGKRPVYSTDSNGKTTIKFLTDEEIKAEFYPDEPSRDSDIRAKHGDKETLGPASGE